MVEDPLCVVEVGGRLGPILVVGAEPAGPLTVGFSGEQFCEPGGSDVGVVAGSRHVSGLWRNASVNTYFLPVYG